MRCIACIFPRALGQCSSLTHPWHGLLIQHALTMSCVARVSFQGRIERDKRRTGADRRGKRRLTESTDEFFSCPTRQSGTRRTVASSDMRGTRRIILTGLCSKVIRKPCADVGGPHEQRGANKKFAKQFAFASGNPKTGGPCEGGSVPCVPFFRDAPQHGALWHLPCTVRCGNWRRRALR